MAGNLAVKQSQLISEAEYLAGERLAVDKHEYYDGYVIQMAGATREHNLITGNIAGELRAQLKGKPCETYSNDMRVKIPRKGRFTYPDVVVACVKPQFLDNEFDTLLNPLLIVEVLSLTSRKYDFSEKFRDYRSIESFTEYLLVAQDSRDVNHFVKREALWTIQEVGERIELTSIGCVLTLDEIYARIEFVGEQSQVEDRERDE